ncbi:hypothetical protein PS941_01092 [Pseudomonas fluorescens]|uniref:Uncharacterized protein n=1 Tax=Pseudomonas fluorescens TaxID=294 RepID=A0A5E7SEZ0_PSEFL|nr:hypothetical protein PS941_01092 [Pseudomonas fluorescens]
MILGAGTGGGTYDGDGVLTLRAFQMPNLFGQAKAVELGHIAVGDDQVERLIFPQEQGCEPVVGQGGQVTEQFDLFLE